MGRSFVTLLLIILAGFAGYVVYSALPLISPRFLELGSVFQSLGTKFSRPAPSPTPTPVAPEISFSDSLIITDYLQSNVGITGFDGEVFCSYKVLGSPDPRPSNLYILALCQEFYEKSGIKQPGSGLVVPISLIISWKNESLNIIGHSIPENGSNYTDSLKTIFPVEIVDYLLTGNYAEDVKNLQQKVNSAVY